MVVQLCDEVHLGPPDDAHDPFSTYLGWEVHAAFPHGEYRVANLYAAPPSVGHQLTHLSLLLFLAPCLRRCNALDCPPLWPIPGIR